MLKDLKEITENRRYPPECPGCGSAMDVWKCVNLLVSIQPVTASALTKLILLKEHIKTLRYCSNEKCNTPFDFDGDLTNSGARVVCPLCNSATCARCGYEWHGNKSCEDVLANNPLRKLAETFKWKHCPNPNCRALIERIEGCSHMECICGTEFCYNCGTEYDRGMPACNDLCDSSSDTSISSDLYDSSDFSDSYVELYHGNGLKIIFDGTRAELLTDSSCDEEQD